MTQYKCDNIHKLDKNSVVAGFSAIMEVLKISKILKRLHIDGIRILRK